MSDKDFLHVGFRWLLHIFSGLWFAFILYFLYDQMDNIWCYLNQIGLFRTILLSVCFLSLILPLMALMTGLNKYQTVNNTISNMMLLSAMTGWFIITTNQYLAMVYQPLALLLMGYLTMDTTVPALNMNGRDMDAKAINRSDKKKKKKMKMYLV